MEDWRVNQEIMRLCEGAFSGGNAPLYRFIQEGIEIHPDWFGYLVKHMQILKGFCFWHLLNYLQKNNPNVPNIAGKLFEPAKRNMKDARKYWRLAMDQLQPIQCIYSRQPVQQDSFSLDHFLPWRFVTHDLLWNLIPTSRSVNSAKGDQLPDTTRFFDPFARLQYDAFQTVAVQEQGNLLEDYILLFKAGSVTEISTMPFDNFRQVLHDTIIPQIQVARNMGFGVGWSYSL